MISLLHVQFVSHIKRPVIYLQMCQVYEHDLEGGNVVKCLQDLIRRAMGQG